MAVKMGVQVSVKDLLEFCIKLGASDLHISAGLPPMIRNDGDMQKVDLPSLSETQTDKMLLDIMNDMQRKAFEENKSVDFSISLHGDYRFRVNVFRQSRGLAAVIRLIPNQILTLKDLDLPRGLEGLVEKEKGFLLVTGPTGSGKSTTLAALVHHINQTRRKHILTIEDPIEFVHTPRKSLINQREIGLHTHCFADALRAALREDPDVILVGELRDLETMSLALTAAETGHLVLATLHTSSAPKSIDRMIDVFPSDQQQQVRAMLAESLLAVVSQTLCKRRDKGRVAALEIMVGTHAVRSLIREAKLHQLPGTMQSSQSSGMRTLEMSLVQLLEQNLIHPDEAISKGLNKELVPDKLQKFIGRRSH
jgi:twitching motility protein PilT